MLKSSLCDYSDAYIIVKGTTAVLNTVSQDTHSNNNKKNIIIKNCAPFIDSISEMNTTQKLLLKTLM